MGERQADPDGRRVLVTGAGGFVGQALVGGFVERGWRVVALDRAFDATRPADSGVVDVKFEIEDRLPDDLPRVDLVVHGAWITADPGSLGVSGQEYLERNMRPAIAVARYVVEAAPAAVVFLSSSGVFGPADGRDVDGHHFLTDADWPRGASPYAEAKRTAEAWFLNVIDRQTTAPHVVRLGYLFGPGEVSRPSRPGVSHIARWVDAARTDRPLEVRTDDPAREWTYAPDLSAALEAMVDEDPAGRAVHLGSTEVLRDSEVAALIADGVPGAEVVRVEPRGEVKAPMLASDVPALRDFAWTGVADGLAQVLEASPVAGRSP